MKKKMSKAVQLIAATTVATSGFVALSPVQTEAASSAENLVKKAEESKVVLMRAISVDYSASVKIQPVKEYNKAKDDYSAAKKAVNQLSGKQKQVLSARLDVVKQWLDRGAGYIDAISSGKKLITLQATLQKHLKAGNPKEATEAYYKLSNEINKQAKILYRVHGKSTRQAILEYYKVPAEEAKEKARFPVSIHIELERLAKELEKGDDSKYQQRMSNIEEWFEFIEEDVLFDALLERFIEVESLYVPEVAEVTLDDVVIPTEASDLDMFLAFLFFDKHGNELDINPYTYGFIIKDDKGYFKEDGTLVDAYVKTGLTKFEKVKIELIDAKTKKVVKEAILDVIDGNKLYYLDQGNLTDETGKNQENLIIGKIYQFNPTLAVTYNGKEIGDDPGESVSLADLPGITFSSTNEKVFTVSSTGKVTAVGSGESSLIVSWNGVELDFYYEVKAK